jgi:hypothetical protein
MMTENFSLKVQSLKGEVNEMGEGKTWWKLTKEDKSIQIEKPHIQSRGLFISLHSFSFP